MVVSDLLLATVLFGQSLHPPIRHPSIVLPVGMLTGLCLSTIFLHLF